MGKNDCEKLFKIIENEVKEISIEEYTNLCNISRQGDNTVFGYVDNQLKAIVLCQKDSTIDFKLTALAELAKFTS